jgi:RNase adapter protein RapZ
MRIIVVTGISGSGKSVALNVLEDSGYFCIDNLPSELLMAAAQNAYDRGVHRLAIATDIRSLKGDPAQLRAHINAQFKAAMGQLRAWQPDLRLLFLSASTACLIARYSETRRRHPLSSLAKPSFDAAAEVVVAASAPASALASASFGLDMNLEDCIELERSWMQGVSESGHIIDTSALSVAALRHSVKQFAQATGAGITLTFESFGFKHAVPQDADLVFDARCLPNPHYDPVLKPLTGLDAPVADYLRAQPAVGEFIDDIAQFLSTWLPRYEHDGRNYLTVAIGCTGGQHRSVYVAEQLALRFASQARVLTRHRQQAAKLAQ